MPRRKPNLETRYRTLRMNAKVMTRMLEAVSSTLTVIAGAADDGRPLLASDIRKWASECQRVATERGLAERGR